MRVQMQEIARERERALASRQWRRRRRYTRGRHLLGVPLAPAALELILPNGVDRYVALLVEAPDIVAGTYVELVDTDYARVPHSAWTTADLGGGVASRSNNGAIVFASMGDADKVVTHWAIFDAATLGNLLAAGPTLNGDGEVQPLVVLTNDQPRFNAGDLALLTEEP